VDHAAQSREACELLRTATELRRAGRWAACGSAIGGAVQLIGQATAEMDRRRSEILAGIKTLARERPVVLVVDDEPAILGLLALVLRQAGFDVVTAGSGPEAVAAFHGTRGGIDLVLLDVQMPKPWDGPRTLTNLQQLDPAVRAAFMSGSTGEYPSADLLARGALRVFAKPFPTLAELTSELLVLVGR
jgi:CheY-like chemotaxis protein